MPAPTLFFWGGCGWAGAHWWSAARRVDEEGACVPPGTSLAVSRGARAPASNSHTGPHERVPRAWNRTLARMSSSRSKQGEARASPCRRRQLGSVPQTSWPLTYTVTSVLVVYDVAVALNE